MAFSPIYDGFDAEYTVPPALNTIRSMQPLFGRWLRRCLDHRRRESQCLQSILAGIDHSRTVALMFVHGACHAVMEVSPPSAIGEAAYALLLDTRALLAVTSSLV